MHRKRFGKLPGGLLTVFLSLLLAACAAFVGENAPGEETGGASTGGTMEKQQANSIDYVVSVNKNGRFESDLEAMEEYLAQLPQPIDYLALVNKQNALPDGWEDAVEIVYMTNRHGEEIGVERVTYEAYCALREALLEEDVHLDINSAYRTVAAQKALAESYWKKYGEDYVKAYVAVPGYSEHHTGLAVDLYLESMDVWAKIHARLAEFGFILRYPEGAEAITGYAYEPWHIRYVGVDAAQEIAARGITLEEYLGAAQGGAK